MHWRPHWMGPASGELMRDCTAVRPAPSSACAACSLTSFPSMLTKDLTCSLRIGTHWTSCSKAERLLMESCPRVRELTLRIQRPSFSAGSKLHLRPEILRNLPNGQ